MPGAELSIHLSVPKTPREVSLLGLIQGGPRRLRLLWGTRPGPPSAGQPGMLRAETARGPHTGTSITPPCPRGTGCRVSGISPNPAALGTLSSAAPRPGRPCSCPQRPQLWDGILCRYSHNARWDSEVARLPVQPLASPKPSSKRHTLSFTPIRFHWTQDHLSKAAHVLSPSLPTIVTGKLNSGDN